MNCCASDLSQQQAAPYLALPLPSFTFVWSEMYFSSLVLKRISTPYFPCVPLSTRMKCEWLLSKQDRSPWLSSSSKYSAGKLPWKHQEKTVTETFSIGVLTFTFVFVQVTFHWDFSTKEWQTFWKVEQISFYIGEISLVAKQALQILTSLCLW